VFRSLAFEKSDKRYATESGQQKRGRLGDKLEGEIVHDKVLPKHNVVPGLAVIEAKASALAAKRTNIKTDRPAFRQW